MGDIKPAKPKTISTTLLSKPSSPDGKKGPSSSKSDHQASIDSYLKYYTFQKCSETILPFGGFHALGDVFRPY